MKNCCLCGKAYRGYGNNAALVMDGYCCRNCNLTKVIPARIEELRLER